MLEFNLASEKVILFSARAQQVKTLVDDFILELKKVRVLLWGPCQELLSTPPQPPHLGSRGLWWPVTEFTTSVAIGLWPALPPAGLPFCLCLLLSRAPPLSSTAAVLLTSWQLCHTAPNNGSAPTSGLAKHRPLLRPGTPWRGHRGSMYLC